MSSDESLTPLEVLNIRVTEVREAMVYAKWGNILWPSRSATEEEFEFHKTTNDTKSKYLVYFFGSHDFGWVNSIKKFEKDSVEEKPKNPTSTLRLAYIEANLLWKDLPCTNCFICGGADHEEEIILCDICDSEYHMRCLIPPLKKVPDSEWICPRCVVLGERKKKRNNNGRRRKSNNGNNNNKKGKKRRRRSSNNRDVDIDDDNDEDDDELDGEKGSRGNDVINEDENYTPNERKKRKSTNNVPQAKEEPSSKKAKTSQNDDYCCICHNNGFLMFCDYKNCTKSYHPQCVGLIHPPEDNEWICPFHYCKMCLKMSENDDIYYHCTNCPSSWCSVECMEKDVSTITIHSNKKCTYCSTPSPLIMFTLVLENCLMKIIQSKVGNIFYLPFEDDKSCSLRNVLKEIRSLSFTNYPTFLEYLRQTLNKMCSSKDNNDDGDNSSFPYLRKAANITFETIKTIIERDLKFNNMLDIHLPEDVDKSSDINFRKELTLFPDEEDKIITTKQQREKYCSNLKVVPVEHKLPEINQPVTSKVIVHPKLDNSGAKVQITQIPPPGIPLEVLKSVPLSDDEDKRLVKILSKIPQGESQSYRDYVTLDLPSIMSVLDQQNILIRKLVEQNAIVKKSLSKIYESNGSDNNNNNNRTRTRKSKIISSSQQQQQQQEPPPPPSLSTVPGQQLQQSQQPIKEITKDNENKEEETKEETKEIKQNDKMEEEDQEPIKSTEIISMPQQQQQQQQEEKLQEIIPIQQSLPQESIKMEECSDNSSTSLSFDVDNNNINKEYMTNVH